MIEITGALAIPEEELTLTASRSGGPGGQNVNKVATRVTLLFDVHASPSLTAEQKALLAARLSTRMSRAGVLRVVSQRHRSQWANREEAVRRFADLLRGALEVDPQRVPTRPTRAARERRVTEKKHHARLKQRRVRPGYEE